MTAEETRAAMPPDMLSVCDKLKATFSAKLLHLETPAVSLGVVNEPLVSVTERAPAPRTLAFAFRSSMNSEPTKFSGMRAPPPVKDDWVSARHCGEFSPKVLRAHAMALGCS
jgi:hypothetical protein